MRPTDCLLPRQQQQKDSSARLLDGFFQKERKRIEGGGGNLTPLKETGDRSKKQEQQDGQDAVWYAA